MLCGKNVYTLRFAEKNTAMLSRKSLVLYIRSAMPYQPHGTLHRTQGHDAVVLGALSVSVTLHITLGHCALVAVVPGELPGTLHITQAKGMAQWCLSHWLQM